MIWLTEIVWKYFCCCWRSDFTNDFMHKGKVTYTIKLKYSQNPAFSKWLCHVQIYLYNVGSGQHAFVDD